MSVSHLTWRQAYVTMNEGCKHESDSWSQHFVCNEWFKITRYWKIPHLKIYYLISLTVYIKIINGEMLYIISEVREQHIIHNDWLLIAPGQRLVWYYREGLVELVADFCFLDSASSSVLSTGVFSFIKKTIISADMRHITEETAVKHERIIQHSC